MSVSDSRGDGGSPRLLYSERGGGARQKLMAVDACLERVLGGNGGSGGNPA